LILCSLLATPLAFAAGSPGITLKEAAHGKFRIGAAINAAQITGADRRGDEILLQHFDSITPEDCLKWENVHPQLGRYDFSISDQYVKFGTEHKLFVIGHTLMWHNQTPDWVFQDEKGKPVSKEELLKRLREHIATVVGR